MGSVSSCFRRRTPKCHKTHCRCRR
uniref:Uncharacterized protein n=1 Tax=Anguilla anguilla TaxID=7936 RepID=A0A0E9P5N5_ANGAN